MVLNLHLIILKDGAETRKSMSNIFNQDPMQNGYIERFNRLYREAVLDAYLFFELYQVRQLTNEWMEEYNYRRSHERLDNLTPEEWKNRLLENENTLKVTV
jgi:putative transposase